MGTNGENFWGGDSPTTPVAKKELTPAEKDAAVLAKNKLEFSWWWVVLGVAVVGLIGLAIGLNAAHNNSAENFSGTIDIDNGDTKINWNRYATYNVELTGTYTITESGTYYLTGAITDGAIIVDTPANAVVRLVLDNVSIKNSSGPAIYCYNGDDLVIELVGENYLEDGKSYSAELDEDITGAVYSKADLSFTGDGSLTVVANYQDGIVSKDDLKFNSGTYKITAADDGIRGKDSVYIVDGNFEIVATTDGIKATNETDTTKGFVLVKDGTVTIAAGDDGIHAYSKLIIDGGTINITKSYEGLEAKVIAINAGKISVYANDDGVNAGGGSDSTTTAQAGAFEVNESCELSINGGELYVNAAGDGLDSNGYIYINGGIVTVDGPTNSGNGALDSAGGIIMNGGTVVAIGASGMAETLGSNSIVNNISVYFSSTLAKGTVIEIKNAAGETVLSHTSAKTFGHMAAGTEAFKAGETYTIYVNGTEYQSFTVEGTTTTVGSGGGMQNMGTPGGQNQQTQTNRQAQQGGTK